MEGKIYIDGRIGKEVTLESVRNQVLALGDIDVLNVDINSGGGDVDEGYAIHDYLVTLGIQVNTKAVGICASIATVILLAGDQRSMLPNAELMIHNPWIDPNKPMGARELEDLASHMREAEEKLANFYSSKLGSKTKEISELMNVETRMNLTSAKSIGFINAQSNNYKVFASVKLKDMDKKESLIKDIQAKLSKLLKGEETPQAAEIALADGTIVAIDSEDGEFVGKSITLADGNPLEDGTYDLEDGRKLTVSEGMVSEVMEAEEGDSEEVAALKAEIETLKATALEGASALEEAEKVNAEMKASIDNINETVNALVKENKAMASVTVGGKDPVKAAVKTPEVKKEESGLASGLAGFLKLN